MNGPRMTPRAILGASLLLGALQINEGCITDEGGYDPGALTMRSVSSGDVQYAQIIAGWDSNFCLDVAGVDATNNGKNVQLWQCDQVSETWNLGTDGKIHAGWSSNVCLDVAGTNATANGTNVGIWQCDQVTETWTLGLDGKLRAQWDTSVCLDIYGTNESANGKNAKIWQCDDAVVETFSMRTSTGWLDQGNPGAVGAHDWEKLAQHMSLANIPSEMIGIEPAYVEMRLVATGEDIAQTGDLKNLSTQYGGKARNEAGNPIEGDYEIQFHYGWTPWVNRDTDPSDGDDETHAHYTNWTKTTGPTTSVGSVLTGRMPPRNPTRTECRLVDEPTTIYSSDDTPNAQGLLTATWSGSQVAFRCDNEVGYECDEADQDPGVTCSEDVEVRHFFGYEELCWGDTADATDNGACEPRAGHGESCTSDSDCESNVCDEVVSTCANCTALPQQGCDFDTQYCEFDACHDKKAVWDDCVFSEQCQSGICDAFNCVECVSFPTKQGCDFDTQYCDFWECLEKKAHNETCEFDDQCESDMCDAGYCAECTAIPQDGCDFGSQYCELGDCRNKKANGQGCGWDDQCQSGICDAFTCVACTAVPKEGCNFGSQYCEFASCHNKKPSGQACAFSDQCQSNNCLFFVCL
ncbi:RICIN domain-containing protein [Paraliomyxa miuraensis]|uniref:RICIN domain-containing protein n=1 Tax=Paraliomyxa miuraensis TaxID=376150 RepID=UPI00224CF079|nr:RICIN domain-containing protein [Paraliomyxa miuraensis]MCX4240834.1 ricin-type beta-trefoil lectin domain protein [Paraliomyxa miuraensis]